MGSTEEEEVPHMIVRTLYAWFVLLSVQAQVIPWLLAAHSKPIHYWPRDICVSAPTGSGKTLAFVIPIVQVIVEAVR